jgi:pyruvate, orthophosphate dikinase
MRNVILNHVDGEYLLTSSLTAETLHSGDLVTVDGGGGRLLRGLHSTVSHLEDEDFQTVLGWADKYRKLRINASISSTCWNKSTAATAASAAAASAAETGTGASSSSSCCSEGGGMNMLEQVREAQRMGADGLGCICTDGMFNSTEERSGLMCHMLVHHADSIRNVYRRMEELHKEDFKVLFRTAMDRNVVVKLLDCALQKFLPTNPVDIAACEGKCGMTAEEVTQAIQKVKDNNPDFGYKGCRIITHFQSIVEMQVNILLIYANQHIQHCSVSTLIFP